jgi:hypothetical protein
MLLSIIGELHLGTSPRPVMETRLIVPGSPECVTEWRANWPWHYTHPSDNAWARKGKLSSIR